MTTKQAKAEATLRWKNSFVECSFSRPESDQTPRLSLPYRVGYKAGWADFIKGMGNSWEEAFRDADENAARDRQRSRQRRK